jgi:lactose/L-arabinose transport system permease protein
MGEGDVPSLIFSSGWVDWRFVMSRTSELTLASSKIKTTTPAPKRNFWKEIRQSRWAYVFISPFFLFWLVFGLYPFLYSIVLSFTNRGVGADVEFIGLANYILLLKDKVFWKSIMNGAILFMMYVPIMTFLALVLAVVLNSKRVRGFRIFRTIIFMPFIMNMIAAGFTFQLMFNERYGLFNNILAVFHIPPVPWLESEWGARVSLCLLVIWAWLGYNMVIMLAGLQTIPGELTEAAMIDGASPAQAFLRITIPLMRPVILFSVVLSTMGSFNLFGELVSLFSTTGGEGPLNSTITPLLAIFNQTFTNSRFGYASALAYVYFAIVFLLTLFQVRYFGGRVD